MNQDYIQSGGKGNTSNSAHTQLLSSAAEDLHATETEMRRLAGLVEQCRKELDDVLSKK